MKWERSRFFISRFLEQTYVKIGQNRHNFSKKGSQRGSQKTNERALCKMKTVKQSFTIEKGFTVLVFESFYDEIITDRLLTNVKIFESGEYTVEKAISCFGKPQTRNILIKQTYLDNEIKQFEFI